MAKFILSGFADEIDPQLDVQLKVMNELEIGHIEVRGIDGVNVSKYTPDQMKDIKKKFDRANIKVSSIGSPIGKIKITDPMDDHINEFKNIIEIAKIMDTKYIRLFSFFMPKEEDPKKYRDEVLKRMQMFVDTAKGSGLILLHENEKGIYGDNAARCLDVLESIGSSDLKAVFDPANFVQCKQETFPEAYNMLKPYIEYMHIKDALEDGNVVPAGMGIGKVKEILADLKASNYEGFLSLEPHLSNFVGLASLEEGKEKEAISTNTQDKFRLATKHLRDILAQI